MWSAEPASDKSKYAHLGTSANTSREIHGANMWGGVEPSQLCCWIFRLDMLSLGRSDNLARYRARSLSEVTTLRPLPRSLVPEHQR